MIPEDPIFSAGAEGGTGGGNAAGEAAQTAKAGATGNGKASTEGTTDTGADLDARIQAAVEKSPLIGKLALSSSNMEKFVREMSETLQGGQGGTGAGGFQAGSAEEKEWIQQFYDNPEGAVDARFSQAALPIVAQVAQAQADLQLDKFAQEIDQEWGAGAFDGVLRESFQGILDRAMKQNPTSVLNKQAMRSTLSSLAYESRKALAEHKEKAQTQTSAQESERFNAQMQAAFQEQGIDPSTLRGGIRRVAPKDDKLPNDLHEYLAGTLRETGRVVDEKRAARMMRTGNTLSDWEAADKELSGGGGS